VQARLALRLVKQDREAAMDAMSHSGTRAAKYKKALTAKLIETEHALLDGYSYFCRNREEQ
jgi:hypothetical protein